MNRNILFGCLGWMVGGGMAAAQENDAVHIEAPPVVKHLLEAHLPLARAPAQTGMSVEARQQLMDATPAAAADLLATQGYFSPHISIKHTQPPGGLTIVVDPGPPTKIDTFTVGITGAVIKDAAFPRYQHDLVAAWPLKQGQVFTQTGWDQAKRAGTGLLAREKYARATLKHSYAKIVPATQQAEVSVLYDSGPVYTLGQVRIEGLKKYPEKMVQQQIHFSQGDLYAQEKLLDLQSTLQNFPHFSSALVEMDFAHEKRTDSDHIEAPVVVVVQEAPLHKINIGVGYGSDSGSHGKVAYQYHNVASRGWVLATEMQADRLEKTGKATLTVPKRGSGYDDSFYTQYKESHIQQLFSRQKSVGAQRTRKKKEIETLLVLDYTAEHQRFGDQSWEGPQALVLNYKWIRRRLDNIADPRSGNMLWLEGGIAAQGLLSDTSFIRLRGTGTVYWPLGKKNTLMTRVELGQVFAGNDLDIPSKWLFRAGGSNSVRGYNYESLGVSRRGSIVGGRVMGTGTVEYQRAIYQQWRAAVFVDAGDAAKKWQEYRLHTGAGVGARWVSPIGLFGADLAYGFQEKKWRFYLSMGFTF